MHHGHESEHADEHVGDQKHGADLDRAQNAESSVRRGTIGGDAPDGGLGVAGLDSDRLVGSNATGGSGDESTGLSDEAQSDPATEAPR